MDLITFDSLGRTVLHPVLAIPLLSIYWIMLISAINFLWSEFIKIKHYESVKAISTLFVLMLVFLWMLISSIGFILQNFGKYIVN